MGRFGNTRTPISVEQVKTWLGLANTSIIVRPVFDLVGHQHTDAYEVPDRIRRQVVLRDHHCPFPHCARPAESGDVDHITPFAEGGPTCTCNLAGPCRGHHRMKTDRHASYRMLEPGIYYWTLPSGSSLVTPTGTHDLTPPSPRTSPPDV